MKSLWEATRIAVPVIAAACVPLWSRISASEHYDLVLGAIVAAATILAIIRLTNRRDDPPGEKRPPDPP